MHCTNSGCGMPVNVIPAGVSKKTGKAYGSFWKCANCGTAGQVGPQPARGSSTPSTPGAGPWTAATVMQLFEILKRIEDKIDGMEVINVEDKSISQENF